MFCWSRPLVMLKFNYWKTPPCLMLSFISISLVSPCDCQHVAQFRNLITCKFIRNWQNVMGERWLTNVEPNNIPTKPLQNSDTVWVHFNHFYCTEICDILTIILVECGHITWSMCSRFVVFKMFSLTKFDFFVVYATKDIIGGHYLVNGC